MNAKELTLVLKQHKLWLKDHSKGKRAGLRGMDLQSVELWKAIFRKES